MSWASRKGIQSESPSKPSTSCSSKISLVRLCPARKKYGAAKTVKFGTVILTNGRPSNVAVRVEPLRSSGIEGKSGLSRRQAMNTLLMLPILGLLLWAAVQANEKNQQPTETNAG